MRVNNYPPPPPPDRFGVDVPNYTGPKDGYSQSQHEWLLKPVNRFMVALAYRVEVEGAEKFPQDGKHVYCPTHPSFFDPILIPLLSDRDMRYVAAENVFDGLRGHVMTWGGAFPTDLNYGRSRTVRHAIDMVRQGKGLTIFPEGKISEDPQRVERLKQGAAFIAHHGGAESIVPIGVHYLENDQPRENERLAGWLAAGALTAGGLLAIAGGPATRLIAGAVTGALTGVYGGGAVARHFNPNPQWCDPFPQLFAGVKGGAAGAAIGGIAGALAALHAPEALLASSLLAGGATLGLAEGWRNRPIARLKIGEPLKVKPYFDGGGRKAGYARLTEDLHRSLGHLKADLTGVPYEEDSRKLFNRAIDPPVGVGWRL